MIEVLTPKQRSAFNRALKHRELLPLLYGKVNELYWFDVFQEAGLLDPQENPTPQISGDGRTISIQYWPALEYLVNSSEKLSDEKNIEYANKYLQLIRSVTKYAIDNNQGNYRTWWQFAKILKHIPVGLIHQEDLSYIEYWLDDKYERGLVAEELGILLVKLLHGSSAHSLDLAEELLKIIYHVQFEVRKLGSSISKEAFFRFDKWHAQKITEKCAALVGEKLRRRGLSIFHDNLSIILNEIGNHDFSAIWQPAIEDHEQNQHRDDAENILVEGYRDSLLKYIETSVDEARIHLNDMFESKYAIIRRIAIYAIDKNLQAFSEFTDKILDREYFTSEYRHEIWWFLKNNYINFSNRNKKNVLEIIESIERIDDREVVNAGATAYMRAIWLQSIKEAGDVELEKYNRNIQIAGAEPDHPDFSSYMSVGWKGHKSPIPLEELAKLPIDDLVITLASYNDPGGFMEPGIEGLAKTFKQLIKTSPNYYYSRIECFLELDLAYVYEVIEAYRDLWSEKSQLHWNDIWQALLNYCLLLVQQERFWSEENEGQREHFVANRFWIVSAIGRLIESGTKSDDHAFDEKHHKIAEQILTILLNREKGEEYNKDADAVSKSINSPRGHCLEALINLTLRSCRIADKKNNNHLEVWSHFQVYYDAELSRADADHPEYEFVTLVTNYLPNFLYMSKTWVLDNLHRIFNQTNYLKWLCAMQGYAYVGTIYPEIYTFLKNNGDFIRGLDDENLKEQVKNKVVQNIAVAYISEFEKYSDENSLLKNLIQRNNSEELSQLIWFIWTKHKAGDKSLQSKVYKLWAEILRNTDLTTDKGKRLASNLCHWVAFVDTVDDEIRKLIYAVAPYADESYNSYDLLRNIASISDVQPIEAYGIMVKMFEGSFPDYPEKAVKKILENLIKQGQQGRQKAKEIVDIYLKNGIKRPFNILNELMGLKQRV